MRARSGILFGKEGPATSSRYAHDIEVVARDHLAERQLLAARLHRDAGEGRVRDNARQLLESARRRLEYWDIPNEGIRRIEESGAPTKTLTLSGSPRAIARLW